MGFFLILISYIAFLPAVGLNIPLKDAIGDLEKEENTVFNSTGEVKFDPLVDSTSRSVIRTRRVEYGLSRTRPNILLSD